MDDTSFSFERSKWEAHSTRLVAVDPGDVHVGVALFGRDALGWECVGAMEMTPEGFEDWLAEELIRATVDILVVEEWKLFPDHGEQVGSDMPTSQLIGAIKFMWRSCKSIAKRWPAPDVELVMQSPQIKIPTRAVLKNRKMTSMAKFLKIPLDHAADAELHGYHYIIKTLQEPTHQTYIKGLQASK